jgi:hypothetical protein
MGFGPEVSIGEAVLPAASPSTVPIVTGAAGLIGRPLVRPIPEPAVDYDEDGYPTGLPTLMPAGALPSPCHRLLTVPDRGDGTHQCDPYCAGRQRDGSCLCDVVRKAQVTGVQAKFEVDAEGYWNIIGG